MKQQSGAIAAAFLAGFVGWLGVGAIRAGNEWPWIAAVALGVAAALVARRSLGLPALWLGVAAAYPVPLALGVIAYLGENWWLYFVMFLVAASVGFGVAMLVLRTLGSRGSPRPS